MQRVRSCWNERTREESNDERRTIQRREWQENDDEAGSKSTDPETGT